MGPGPNGPGLGQGQGYSPRVFEPSLTCLSRCAALESLVLLLANICTCLCILVPLVHQSHIESIWLTRIDSSAGCFGSCLLFAACVHIIWLIAVTHEYILSPEGIRRPHCISSRSRISTKKNTASQIYLLGSRIIRMIGFGSRKSSLIIRYPKP